MSLHLASRHTSFSLQILFLAVLISVLVPGAAQADGFIIPFAGVNFAGDSGKEFGDAVDAKRFSWGGSLGWMGAGVIGVEGDFSYSPDFFGKNDLGGSSVLTAMGNLLVGVPLGGQKGFGVRPYALAGIGAVRPEGDAFNKMPSFRDTKVGWDVGGGVMLFFATHVGVRADLRYIRTFQALEFLNIDIANKPGDLDFARGSIGLILRF
jgi:opacity protein-like surface antigen